ncbi:MAG: hypothetical protein ABIB71_03680 [Candidatus Woesearchaeota archaeon]
MLEEYISEHPEMEDDTRQKLRDAGRFIVSEFVVISKDADFLMAKDRESGKHYRVMLLSKIPSIGRNTLLTGRIHAFGDAYLFAGAFGIHNSPIILDPDVMMHAYEQGRIREIEGMLLSENSRLAAILNKFPSQWVDGICENLSLDAGGRKGMKAKLIAERLKSGMGDVVSGLPERSRDALRLVLGKGGCVRYSVLKGFDDGVGLFWRGHPPSSAIGVLRAHGLLVVGRMFQNGRRFRVALVPKDIRGELLSLGL